MQNGLQDFVNTKKQEGNLAKQGEEATKQGLILPMLHHLGWNPFDVQEVFPEYSVQSGRVDYALRVKSLNKVFIEVKKVSEDLDKHQEQLLRYAFTHGVKLAILTNGNVWWFYLPLHEGSWEQRRFYTIDIQSQAVNDITEKFTAFLSKQEVVDGKAIINAENIYNSRQKGEAIKQTLPKAWRKLLSENDDFLSEVVAESVEKLSGYKPDIETVINFLKEISGESLLISTIKKTSKVTSLISVQNSDHQPGTNTQIQSLAPVSSFAYKKPISLEFNGVHYKAKSWITLLKTFLQILSETHPNEIHNLSLLTGKKRPYFTTDSSQLRQAAQLLNSNLFFETNLSSNDVVKLINRAAQSMGYSSDSVKIHFNE